MSVISSTDSLFHGRLRASSGRLFWLGLTLVVGVLFMIQGAFEIFFAVETRPHAGWMGMLISGIASIVMAILIAAGWPAISVIVLGILLGVNFISTGFGYILVSRSLKPA